MFALQQQIEIKEEGERNMREMIKVEQDEAFQLSLAIDRYIFTSNLVILCYIFVLSVRIKNCILFANNMVLVFVCMV